MSPSAQPEPISGEEQVARFILQSKHIRQDRTIKPDAFIPIPYVELSVTRHVGLSEEQIWVIAKNVAASIPKTLYGRTDLKADVFHQQGLPVVPHPEADNPNHANVINWPSDKPSQKLKAQEIAAQASLLKVLPAP